MGKNRGSQRTKDNVRPSNSGRSAELLTNTGMLNFIGFNSLKSQHLTKDADDRIDGQFSMVMKKMQKRDATTKLKALQDFADLCCEKDKDCIISILPFWPRLYNKLALDTDRRIREVTQQANAKLIEKVNREIAPYLRSLMSVWLISQCDIYAPASSVASNTFSITFPTKKKSEALMFCRDEIFQYIKDCLFEQNAESLSEPNSTVEEKENKYVLVIAGCLKGLKVFFDTLSSEDRKCVIEEMKNIVKEKKFWKLSKNKSPQIRVSWYELVSTLSHREPDVFANLEHKLGISVLGSLSESDASVALAVWEAALHYIAAFENCWDNIDIHKIVLPELWTLLKVGGSGNASLLFPCLLPFLSKVPVDALKNKKIFFADFFSSIKGSLFIEGVKRSMVECNAIISAFMECLLYVCLHVNLDDDQVVILRDAICNQLYSLVERSLAADGSHLPISKFYPLLGKFLQTLETSDCENCNNAFGITEALQIFWDKTNLLCSEVLGRKEHLQQNADLVFLAYFFHCLYDPQCFLQKKAGLSVSFSDRSKPESVKKVHQGCSEASAAVPVSSNANRQKLLACSVNTCKTLLNQSLETGLDCHHTKLLTEILSAARSPLLFTMVLHEFSVPTGSESDGPLLFLQHFLHRFLQMAAGNIVILENIMDISFIICSCSNTVSALKVLKFCSEVDDSQFLKILLEKTFKSQKEENVFEKFLLTPEFAVSVEKLFQFIIQKMITAKEEDNLDSYCNVLSGVLQPFFKHGLNFKLECIDEIFFSIKRSLDHILKDTEEDGNTLNFVALEFISDVVIEFLNCSNCWTLDITGDLVKVFFSLGLLSKMSYSAVLYKKIQSVWLMSIKKYVELQTLNASQTFLRSAAEKMHSLIFSHQMNDMRHLILDNISVLVKGLQNEFCDSSYQNVISCVISGTIEQILPSEYEWKKLRNELNIDLLPSFLQKKLFFPLKCCEIVPPCESVPMYLHIADIVSEILIMFTELDEVSRDVHNSNHLKEHSVKSVLGNLHELIWAFSYCESKGYLSKKDTVKYTLAQSLQEACLRLLAFVPKPNSFELFNQLLKKKDMVHWILPLHHFAQFLESNHSGDKSFLSSDNENSSQRDSEMKYVVDQVLINHLPASKKADHLLLLIPEISALLEDRNEDCLGIISKVCCCLSDNVVFTQPLVKQKLMCLVKKFLHYPISERVKNETYYSLTMQFAFILNETIQNNPSSSSFLCSDLSKFLSSTSEHMIEASDKICEDACVLMYILHLSSLLHSVLVLLKDLEPPLPLTDGDGYFAYGISRNIVNLFLKLSATCATTDNLPDGVEMILTSLAESIGLISDTSLMDALFPDGSQHTEVNITHILENLLPLLTSNVRPLQLGTHSVIMRLMGPFSTLIVNEKKGNNTGEITEMLKPLIEVIKYTCDIVQNMLLEFRICDCCVVVPNTDSYTYTSAYLFAWNELFQFYVSSNSQERSACVAYLENSNLLSSLLSNLFRLMPENPLSCYQSNVQDSKIDVLKDVFCEPPSLLLSDLPSASDLHHLVCNTYYNTIIKFPALVRIWWNNLDKCSADAVNSFTSKYVSPLITMREIQAVNQSSEKSDGMKIRAHLCFREVVATYSIDGSDIELVIQLPSNYPLGPCSIEKRGNVKLVLQQWRHWLMQLTAFLTYQNGSILEGLYLWKRNLDKKFDGIEECPICYFILHMSTAELPSHSCSTCKKKFHAECMRKWFTTSNNSTCPLCRNLW